MSDRPENVTRRAVIKGAAAALTAEAARSLFPPNPAAAQTPQDPTKVQGKGVSELGVRAAAEHPKRKLYPVYSGTPHQDLHGMITPADLHYERHHGGVPTIDPESYTLLVHGQVERPLIFTLGDLKRFPATSYIRFLECSGNFYRNAPENIKPEEVAPLTSTSEWTGVPLQLIMDEVGVDKRATWFLAEGQDAAVMTRSIPIEKALDDAILAYAQNGEAIRPANGYPVRLLLPGWEGNTSVKWLRRLEFSAAPFMTREETSKYTESLKNGTARQFSFVMDARSLITSPAYPETIEPGFVEIRGFAWSGRGRIKAAEISVDEGATWRAAELQQPIIPKAHTRFRFPLEWDGKEITIMSRATDETGYVQPTQRELIDARGLGIGPYHLNPITGWRIKSNGQVVFRTEKWI